MAVQIIGPYKDTHSVLVRIGRNAEYTAHSKRASTDSMPSSVIFFGIYTSEKPTRSCFWSHPSEHACNIHQPKATPVLAPKGYPDAHNTDNQTSLKKGPHFHAILRRSRGNRLLLGQLPPQGQLQPEAIAQLALGADALIRSLLQQKHPPC